MSNDRVEPFHGEDYVVRRVTGSAATKPYRCPGCQQVIRPGISHLVVVPDGEADMRRHWHGPCWRRERRAWP